MAKIGLFGGAFDPIHQGHMALAEAAMAACGLDLVRFIPTHLPVHKAGCQAQPWQRAAMIALALNEQPRMILEPCELLRATPSYAIDTIDEIKTRLGDEHRFYWLLGEDALIDFRSWHRWQAIIAQVDLIVVNRPGFSASPGLWVDLARCLAEGGHALHRLTMPPQPAASHLIRRNSRGCTALPLLVQAFIEAEGLYRS